MTGGNWQTIRTSSRSWSDQGLRYYKGLAWYRQSGDIPAEAKGQRVFLWFGAIDEEAKVWVNGRSIGVSPKITFKPVRIGRHRGDRAGQAQPGGRLHRQREAAGTGHRRDHGPGDVLHSRRGQECQAGELQAVGRDLPGVLTYLDRDPVLVQECVT